jgi:hypothetical protein
VLTHLRLMVRTRTETDVFVRDAELESLPRAGEVLKISDRCGPYRVRAATVGADGTAVCELEHLQEPIPTDLPGGIRDIQPELWDLASAGWRNADSTNISNRQSAPGLE